MEIETNTETRGQKLLRHIILEHSKNIEEDIICHLCKGIVVEPKSCGNCEMYFCEECISAFLASHANCPCGVPFESQVPHKIFQRVLGRHRFECANKDKGCRGVFPYKQIFEHEENCEYVMTQCTNGDCEKVLLKKEMPRHLTECPYRQEKCEYCKKLFLYLDLELHHNNCDRKPSKCKGCGHNMFQSQYAQHFAVCEDVQEKCPECNTMIKRKDRLKHDKTSCVYEKFLKSREDINKEIDDAHRLISYLKNRIKDQEAFFGNRCSSCNKFACEVSKKNCEGCKKIYCIPCSRKAFKNCKSCDTASCMKCFGNQEACTECHKRKATKNANSKGKVIANV